ncbi:MAG: esterase FrsA [Proteobacteria bacterium]|nr:esterase FrsA [Pseudomonadota bacterium]
MEDLELLKRSSRRYYFQGEDIDYYFSWILSRQSGGGSELAELYETASRIDESRISSWVEAWVAAAGRLEALGRACLAGGHEVSARDAFLRASSYYRTVIFGLRSSDPGFREALADSRSCFRRSMDLFPQVVEPVGVPFEGWELPGYFIRPDASGAARPTVIMIGGLETWIEDLYFYIGRGALRRGYNVLAVDLPGQGNNPFEGRFHRPDSERPIGAAVDYALGRQEVDAGRLALYGISFGGYLVTHAAVFEKRIRACVANAPILDLHEFTVARMPRVVLEADASFLALDAFPIVALEKICWAMGRSSPAEVVEKTRSFTSEGLVGEIECPFLVLAGAGESEEQQRQARQCYDELRVGRKDIRITTAEAGSDAHCHVDNISFMSHLVFDWLDEVLAG